MEFSGYSHNGNLSKGMKEVCELANYCESSEQPREMEPKITESTIKRKVILDVMEYLQKIMPENDSDGEQEFDKNEYYSHQCKEIKKELKKIH